MSKYSNTVEYNIRTTLDDSGIAKLQAEIRQTQQEIQRLSNQKLVDPAAAEKARQELQSLQKIITKSFNAKLGMLDLRTFSAELSKAGMSLSSLSKDFSAAGFAGQRSFNEVLGRLGKLDTGLKSVSKTTDKIFNTIGNTVRWGVIASGFQGILNSAHEAVQYVKDLDESLTNIMMVTDYSKQQMNDYAKNANEAAKALGSTTVAMTDATLVFAQQGFDLDKSSQLAELSTKLANASQQDTATTSDQITAYMNAYGMDSNMEQLSLALDKWAEVANVSAADVQELATASQKAASTANTVGVNMDQLAAQIATIESVTREAPENIGNGLKTLYARFADIGMGETLEDGVDLGQVTGTLEKVGVQVLNAEGKMNSVGDIMEDLMEVWGQLDTTQKNAIATTLAGKYQLSRFEALMNRSDLYADYKQSSIDAEGTLDIMNEKYIDSLAGKLNTLQATTEDVMNNLFASDDFNGLIDALTTAVQLMADFVEAVGGGGAALTAFGAIATRVFSQSMGNGLANVIGNYQKNKIGQANKAVAGAELRAAGLNDVDNAANKSIVNFMQKGLSKASSMSTDQQNAYNSALEKTIILKNEELSLGEKLQVTTEATAQAYKLVGVDNVLSSSIDENGEVHVDRSAFDEYMATDRESFELKRKQVENLDFSEIEKTSNSARLAMSELSQEMARQQQAGNQVKEIDEQYINTLSKVDTAIDKVVAALGEDNVTSQKLKAIKDQLIDTNLEESASWQQVGDAAQEAARELEVVNKASKQASQGQVYYSGDELTNDQNNYTIARSRSMTQEQENQGLIETIDTGAMIGSLINVAGAVSQVVFAWQSFQSLGSLFANNDLEPGEKLSQIVMNLAISVPMLASAWDQFNQVIEKGSIKRLATNLEKYSTETIPKHIRACNEGRIAATRQYEAFRIGDSTLRQVQISSVVSAAKFRLLGAAATAASVGVNVLNKALSIMSGPWGIAIMAGIMAVQTAISAFSESTAQAYNDAKEKADNALSSYQDFSSKIDSFNSLYESYKQTGKVTDEFRQSAEELTSTIGNQSAEIALAAGNYDKLAEAIQNADEAERKATKTDIESFLAGSNANSLKGNFLGIGNGSVFADAQAAIGYNQTVDAAGNLIQESKDADLSKAIFQAQSENNFGKAINAIQSKITDYNDELDDLDKQISQLDTHSDTYESDKQKLQNQKDAILKQIDSYNSFLNQDDVKDYIEKTNALASLNAQDLQGKLDGLSYQEIVDQYFNSENGMNEFLTNMSSWSEQLSWMISQTTEGTAKLKLQLQQAYEQNATSLYDKVFAMVQEGDIDISSYGANVSNEDATNAIVENIQNQIKNSDLSEQTQLQLLASIDEDASLQEIQQQIEKLSNNPELANALEFKPTFTNRIDNTEDEISSLLKDSGVSENAFNRMSADMYSDEEGYFQAEKSRLQNDIDSIQDGSKSFDEVVSNAESAEEAISELKREYGNLASEAKDVVAANIRLNKGVQALQDSWEDVSEVLQDDASKGTADWYEALDTLDEAMSDILNIDVGTLSNDFYENEDALNAMAAAAEGDMAAIDQLRMLATEDIIQHLDIDASKLQDGETLESIRSELLTAAQSLQADLDANKLTMTSDLDTTDYVQKLNQMIADGQITAEQASAALSSMGVSGTLDYIDADVQVPEITYETTGDIESALKDGGQFTVKSWVSKYTPAPGKIPQFKGTHYTGSGITSVGGKSSGRTGSGSGGGGGKGGGGGSGSSYTPKEKDPIEEEIDRYEKVNTQLQAIENDFDKVADEQDRLAGYQVTDNMNEQIGLLQKQIALHKEKLEIQKDEAKELRNQLSSNYGITFDSEGFITNYATIHRKLESEVNSLINQYNSTTTEDGQEQLEKQIEKAQEKLEDFKTSYQRYDELVSGDMKETLKALEDLEDQIEDLRIEAFQTQVEAADNIKDIQEALIEFNQIFSGLSQDDPFRAASTSAAKLKNYFDVATDSVNDYYDTLIQRMQDEMKQSNITAARKKFLAAEIQQVQAAKASQGDQSIENYGTGYLDMAFLNLNMMMDQLRQFENTGTSEIFGKDSGDMFDVAKDVFDQATEMLGDFEDEIEELRDAIIDIIDDIADRMEERQDAFENITEQLEHQRDIIELLHGEKAYDELNTALAAQQNNYQAQIGELQKEIDLWEDLLGTMEEGTEEWKTVNEQIVDAQENLNDLVQESLENLQEQYENTVSKITDAWIDDALGTDLDWMNDQWELINRNADYYLDDTNAAYSIQKLQGKYLELLDNANGLHVQQQITEQMKQQLGYLREKEKISEYDVAYANAQLEILQKRIALEEAQRNKSQMKLRRDSQGNYSYVYTADEGDVAAAEGDLLDAQNNAYNLSKEQMKQTQDDSLSALQDAKSMIDNIWNDANLSLDEKKKRTQTIIDSLKEYLDGTSEQLSTSEKNIINDFIGMCEMMTDENAERLQDVYDQIIAGNVDAFDQIDTRWSDSLTEWMQNMDEFNQNTDSMFDNLVDNANNYQDQIDEVGDLIETDFNDMGDAIQGCVDKTNDLSNSTADFINQLKSDAGVVKEYENTLTSYQQKIADVNNEMKAYKDQVNDLASKLTSKEQENATLTAQIQELKNPGSSSGGTSNGSSKGKNARAGDIVGFTGRYYYTSEGVAPAGSMYSGEANAVRVSSFSGSPYGNGKTYGAYTVHLETRQGGHLGWVKPSQLFDTGGLTGDWSDSEGNSEARGGKLAWLHQKELVLNASDTENILAAVSAVREMAKVFRGDALNSALGVFSSLNNLKSNVGNDTIDQNVHITAEFPNANNAIEIENALLSLNDRAIQYAWKEK